jgi:hypothetical protein
VILTGEDSTSCQRDLGAGHSACRATTQWGSMVHEIGHGLGLQHPCEGWEGDNWSLTLDQCLGLIMQNHANYPAATFDPREIEILRINPALRG